MRSIDNRIKDELAEEVDNILACANSSDEERMRPTQPIKIGQASITNNNCKFMKNR